MKISLVIFFVIPAIIACNSKKPKIAEQSKEQEYLTRLKNDASNSELMFSLHFGMDRFEVQKALKELLSMGEILSLDNEGFCYKVNISQMLDSIPTTYDEHVGGNNYAPPFSNLYFYAMPKFSNEKLSSIIVTQFLHFNSNEIKEWMDRYLTVSSKERNMGTFAAKCTRVIAATDYLLRSKYSFFDVQKISVASTENSPPNADMSTYWANDFYITMWESIKYKSYDYQEIGYEGFGKRLLNSNFSGCQDIRGDNDSKILILQYQSPKYNANPTVTASNFLFQEEINKEKVIFDQKEELEKIVADSLRSINEEKKKKEMNKF